MKIVDIRINRKWQFIDIIIETDEEYRTYTMTFEQLENVIEKLLKDRHI